VKLQPASSSLHLMCVHLLHRVSFEEYALPEARARRSGCAARRLIYTRAPTSSTRGVPTSSRNSVTDSHGNGSCVPSEHNCPCTCTIRPFLWHGRPSHGRQNNVHTSPLFYIYYQGLYTTSSNFPQQNLNLSAFVFEVNRRRGTIS
jgi:hypothetical protein